MSKKIDALKRAFVAFGYGSNVSSYQGRSISEVLKEFAVFSDCATSVKDIKFTKTDDLLNFLADNKGSEEREPYDLTLTQSHATITCKRRGETLVTGNDQLWNGDVLTITAVAESGYELTTLTVNGVAIQSGATYTVNSHNVVIVATGTPQVQTYKATWTGVDCSISVKKGGTEVPEGEYVLDDGDELVITATPDEGYRIHILKVNGEAFESGGTWTVAGEDVVVEAVGILVAKYTLEIGRKEYCTVSVTRGGVPVEPGSFVLTDGDVITVTATPDAGKTMALLAINNIDIENGGTWTVHEDILVMARAS